MESLIGAPLLVRTRRGSALTPDRRPRRAVGRRGCWTEAAQLDAGIAALRSDRRGHLRIAASLTIAEHLLPGWLVAVRADQVRRRARADRLHDDRDQQRARRRAGHRRRGRPRVRRGARRARGPAPPAGRARRARRRGRAGPRVGRCAPAAGSPPAPSPPHRSSCARPAPARAPCSSGRSRGLPVAAPVLELSSTAAVRAAVAAGAGPAVLGAHAVRDDLATGRLVAVTVTGLDLTRRLNAVWRDGAQPPAGPARELVARARAEPPRGLASDGPRQPLDRDAGSPVSTRTARSVVAETPRNSDDPADLVDVQRQQARRAGDVGGEPEVEVVAARHHGDVEVVALPGSGRAETSYDAVRRGGGRRCLPPSRRGRRPASGPRRGRRRPRPRPSTRPTSSRIAAVFSPMPETPGRLSLESPRRAAYAR